MRWVITFVLGSLGGIGAVLFALWGLRGFRDLGIETTGMVALVAGIVLTSALGVGLMALIFYSDRSRQDDLVYRMGPARDDEQPDSAETVRPRARSRRKRTHMWGDPA